MMPLVLLCALIGIPVLFALIFRVNAIFLFLSLAAGDILVRYLSDDAIVAASAFTRSESMPMVVRLIMLLGPVVLALLILKKSVSRPKVLVQLIPLWFIGLAVASLTIPMFPDSMQQEIFSLPTGGVLRQSHDIIISVAAILTLLLVFQGFRDHTPGKHGKKHRK